MLKRIRILFLLVGLIGTPMMVRPGYIYEKSLLLAPKHSSFAETTTKLQYDVIRNNKVIGHMQAIRTSKGSFTEYLTESSVKVSVVIELAIYTKVIGIFGQGQLISGSVIRRVNSSDKVNATIRWQKDKYVIEEDGEKMTVPEKISYSSACLMHVEPVGLTRIFSEASKKFIPIRQFKPHQYELQLPDGNKNFYSYSDGVCVSAEVNTTLSKAFFRLKK
ncbi:MAG: DUF6134 family protein [Chitinophagaceae bacterium]